MVQTRSRTKGNADSAPDASTSQKTTISKRHETKGSTTKAVNGEAEADRHRQTPTNAGSTSENAAGVEKVQILLDKYGQRPLGDMICDDWPSSQVVMVHIMNALLSSTRISHDIAHRTLKCLVNEGYYDLKTLESSSWQARTEILTQGGYTHYRERTATFLGDLSELMQGEYGALTSIGSNHTALWAYIASDNNPSKLLPLDVKGDNARRTLVNKLKAIKDLGPVGCDIFVGTIQAFFPHVSPFLDKRNCQTAEKIGLRGDAGELYALVGKDPEKMARLHQALTTVRLDKREHELK
ncbi:hypothetical protein O9K51_08596 [Purpureocillium lavendulum]|uniref:Uncharacterized protein n=1 Tax=Purpureocillium lavendulum TaxID=1247861 RepID=A0AB34FJF2_9HYPO|nr:hypothetical protein O9K51_08596 [Purpureocillium lavendulum]